MKQHGNDLQSLCLLHPTILAFISSKYSGVIVRATTTIALKNFVDITGSTTNALNSYLFSIPSSNLISKQK